MGFAEELGGQPAELDDHTKHIHEMMRKRGKLVHLEGKTRDEVNEAARRTSHLVVCKECGKEYIEHPYIDNTLDWEGRPYLHVVCNGDIVKL